MARHDDIIPYVMYHSSLMDEAEAEGTLDAWSVLDVELDQVYIEALEGMAQELGTTVEVLIVSIAHKKAREVVSELLLPR